MYLLDIHVCTSRTKRKCTFRTSMDVPAAPSKNVPSGHPWMYQPHQAKMYFPDIHGCTSRTKQKCTFRTSMDSKGPDQTANMQFDQGICCLLPELLETIECRNGEQRPRCDLHAQDEVNLHRHGPYKDEGNKKPTYCNQLFQKFHNLLGSHLIMNG